VAKSASVIEINGNRYDAVSGQLIGAVKKVAAQVKTPAGGAIDGLVRRPVSVINKTRTRSTKVNNSARSLQQSQTLMRGAVKRPPFSKKTATTSVPKLQKSRVRTVTSAQLLRAKTIAKNNNVDHFGRLRAKGSATRAVSSVARAETAQSSVAKTKNSSVVLSNPLPSMVTSVSHQRLERLLDQALIQADAHKQTLRGRTKGWRRLKFAPKWITVGASSLIVLLLAGFFAWQNIPQVSMRVAATKAHVSASVPAYTPVGYAYVSPVTAGQGKVVIQYKDNDNGSYTITQENSNWDSSSVQANAVPSGSQVQSSQVNGTTVYIYGEQNDAEWVNHGVLFKLQDKANLNSDQILQIANSL